MDNTFQFFFSALLIWFTFSEKKQRHFLSGIASGLLFSTHLMSVSLIIVSALIREVSIKNLLKRAIGFLIPTALYLPTLYNGMMNGGSRNPIPWLDALRNFPRDILFSLQSLSVMCMKYFTGGSLSHFFSTIPFDIYWLILPLTLFMAFRYLNDSKIKFFVLCILAHSIYFFILKVDASHTHYFMPLFIPLLFLFSNLLVLAFRHPSPIFKTVLSLSLGVMMTHLLAYQLTYRSYTLENGGMTDLHVGPSVSSFKIFIQNLCMDSTDPEIKLDLTLLPTVFPQSVEYQFKHQAACLDKK
ncbi:MAG: hypothetical protein KA715_03735 [Xanthomonadaceae bacterium]|nr:hypothetical protein [Xanthomonadaceae bacterium]